VLTRAFYAKGDLSTPVRLAVSMVALNLVLNLVLIWTPLKEAGLAWSTAFCGAVQALVLWRLLHRHHGGLLQRKVLSSAMRSVLATAIMAGAILVLLFVFGPATTWTASLVHLLSAVGVGGAVYVGCAAAAGMPELRWALGRKLDPAD
jgi:putative peptidoglycan lipid II flippase